ncbi:MAG: TadE family protein [Acidobacteriota bacterium]
MAGRTHKERGASTIEFTLVGIPLLFVLISTFEMARGMWIYETLAFATKEGTRYAAVKGGMYVKNAKRTPTMGETATRIRQMAIGMDPAEFSLILTAGIGNKYLTRRCRLSECLSSTEQWPPDGMNMPGVQLGIAASYPFRSAIAMFWPGVGRGQTFPAFIFPATAVEEIQF